MSLEQLIRSRRTIRKFNNLPVSQELVISLLQRAEQLCPYEGEARWRYVFAGSPEARERLANYMLEKVTDNKVAKLLLGKLSESFHKRIVEVPANVIVIAKKSSNSQINDENYGNVCRILQNFQLLGWEERLGMAWITEPYIQTETFFERITIQEDERFVGILQIGYFDKQPKGRGRTPAERKWKERQEEELIR